LGGWDAFVPATETDAVVHADYHAETFTTVLTVALQCVGERLCEEKALEMAGLVREVLEG